MSQYCAYTLTVPAVILNIYNIIVQNVNIIVLLAISIASLIFWIISIQNKLLEKKKNQLEIELMEQQKARTSESRN